MIVVSNSTPLITLAKVGYFDLLQKLFTEITISQEVWDEVVVSGAGLAGSSETSQAGWIKVSSVADSSLVGEWRNAHNLGAGELSTILLAKELTAQTSRDPWTGCKRNDRGAGRRLSRELLQRSAHSLSAVTRGKHLDRSEEA